MSDRQTFEPFGEPLADGERARSRGARALGMTGAAVFWSVVGAVVVARAFYFDPGIFDGFQHVAALARNPVGIF